MWWTKIHIFNHIQQIKNTNLNNVILIKNIKGKEKDNLKVKWSRVSAIQKETIYNSSKKDYEQFKEMT